MTDNSEKIAMRVSRNSIYGNLLISIVKLIAGVIGHSSAMISDAIHSASDVFSTVVVMIGVKIGGKESDKNHQYGHERLESVASLILALTLAVTGCGIGYGGLKTIIAGSEGASIQVPTALPLAAAILSIVAKEGMYWYTMRAAVQINSGALKADAWHHRSDALSSVGSLVGIGGAMLGYPILDPIASVVICVFILKAAFDIFRDAIGKMTDEACDDCMVEAVKALVVRQKGVMALDDIKTRMFGNKAYVDIEIAVDGNLLLKEAHNIAEKVHDEVEHNFPEVKHCMVHVNPYGE
ncbi:MAG: cation diffusion facilitator family transporter [Eubacterium sp.]|nr:cation diffusion facilitator family transporter [Eubacterium sp.]